MNEAGLIYKQIPKIAADLDAVGKDKRNTAQSYNFRGIDDVYNALHPILARHGVFTVPEVIAEVTEERQTKGGGLLIYRKLTIKYRFYAEDGSFVEATVIGEGMDSGDKASNKAMAVAHKYALLQVFSIPTEEAKDPEVDSPAPLPKATRARRPSPPPASPEAVPFEGPPADLPPPPPPREKFDVRNDAHKDRLLGRLESIDFPFSSWDDVGLALNGKLMTEENFQAALQAALEKRK